MLSPPQKKLGNSENVKEILKLSCVADFKRKFQLGCMFPSSAGGKGPKDKEKQFIKQTEVSILSAVKWSLFSFFLN